MSTREYAIDLINSLSDEQVEGLIMLLKGYSPKESIPNADTIEAFAEFDEMKSDPQKYKRYSSFKEIINEVASDV